jgi:hypothetical protein
MLRAPSYKKKNILEGKKKSLKRPNGRTGYQSLQRVIFTQENFILICLKNIPKIFCSLHLNAGFNGC